MTETDPFSRRDCPGHWVRIVSGEITQSIYGTVGAADKSLSWSNDENLWTGDKVITLYDSNDCWPIPKSRLKDRGRHGPS